jgi:TonB family protein
MRRLFVIVLLLGIALPVGNSAAVDDPSYAYHLRVVRVSGAGIDSGTALGRSTDNVEPVVLPAYEAWGTPEQLDGLARTLGAESATPVTGFFIKSDDGGVPHFERPVYMGEEVLDLFFQASPPVKAGDGHELLLKMESRNGGGDPLAEAKLQIRTERTVAIALPSPIENDWLVLAVTLLSQDRLDEQSESVGDILVAGAKGVTQPKLISKVAPEYPEAAKRDKLAGSVILQIVLDKEGIPRAPEVLKMSPGCEELAAAAVEAVLWWRYEPARFDGNPVAVYFTVFVEFKLS